MNERQRLRRKPDEETLEDAGRIIKAEYVTSAVKPSQYPQEDWPEIAFLGRSNVGKSSLINSLCNHRGLALVSGTPGKTQTINFFKVTSKFIDSNKEEKRKNWYLVDLPGYGFAKTNKGSRDQWGRFIRQYVEESKRLRLLCLLIDGRHPDLPIDRQAYEWLVSAGIPLQIVATKMDKLKSSEAAKNLRQLTAQYPGLSPTISYSSLKHKGRAVLTACVHSILMEAEA